MRIMNRRIVNRFDSTINTGSSTLTDSYKDVIDVFKRIEITNPSENIHHPAIFEFDSDKQIEELIEELKQLLSK